MDTPFEWAQSSGKFEKSYNSPWHCSCESQCWMILSIQPLAKLTRNRWGANKRRMEIDLSHFSYDTPFNSRFLSSSRFVCLCRWVKQINKQTKEDRSQNRQIDQQTVRKMNRGPLTPLFKGMFHCTNNLLLSRFRYCHIRDW